MSLDKKKQELEVLKMRQLELYELNDSGELESYEYNIIMRDIEVQIRKLNREIKEEENK